jgi:formate-nitrite transporter family protein
MKLNEEQINGQEQDHGLELSEPESQEAQERSSATVRVVYEAVRREGEEELKRTSSALWWSGLAAGLSMGFSLMIQGVLLHDLPDTPWRRLVTALGYSAGFVVVILGRQQLFTENTLTPILPLLRRRSWSTVLNVGRLWAVVLIANLVGCTIIAWLLAGTSVFPADVRASFTAAAREATDLPFGLALLRGIFAGWLMALLVWLLPFAEHARFFVIITMTWMISICGFTHIVAGSVETIFLTWSGIHSWQQAVGGYIVPVLIGNIIGGVSLVAALNHAQVVT